MVVLQGTVVRSYGIHKLTHKSLNIIKNRTIIFNRTLDFKRRSYSTELCLLLFFDMIGDLTFIRSGTDCVTLHFA